VAFINFISKVVISKGFVNIFIVSSNEEMEHFLTIVVVAVVVTLLSKQGPIQ
jgi:hypothetical protein